MSEKLSFKEHSPDLGLEQISDHESTRIEASRREALEAYAPVEKTTVDMLEVDAKEKAKESASYSIGEQSSNQQQHFSEHKLQKQENYNNTMDRVRSRLNAPERLLSKIAHQRQVDAASNFSAKTVARPSGILGSGIVALLGSAILLYISREYGYTYNYTSFIALIVIGYFIGLFLELVVLAFKRRK